MSLKIAVVTRDRYKTWELKALHRAALRRGAQLALVDPLSWCVAGGELLDERGLALGATVVLGRVDAGCLDEGIKLLWAAESLGIPTVNGSRAFQTGRDKVLTALALRAAGLPHPRTWMLTPLAAQQARLPFPLVTKPRRGSCGRGVRLLDTPAALREAARSARGPLLLQEYVAPVRQDLRLVVIGSRVVAAVRRRPAAGEWRANLALGARAEPVTPAEETASLAVRAAASIGAAFAGVDLLETATGIFVLEVNVCPGFVGVSSATGVDVAGHLVDFLKEYGKAGGGT